MVPEEIPAEKALVEELTILVPLLTAAGPKTSIIVPELQSLSIFPVFTYYRIFLSFLPISSSTNYLLLFFLLQLLIHIWFPYNVADHSMQEVCND